jgi:hypothetical protein
LVGEEEEEEEEGGGGEEDRSNDGWEERAKGHAQKKKGNQPFSVKLQMGHDQEYDEVQAYKEEQKIKKKYAFPLGPISMQMYLQDTTHNTFNHTK